MDLFEHAAAASDKAEALLQAITESDMTKALTGGPDEGEDSRPPAPPVRVVLSETWRPEVLAAALLECTVASTEKAEEIVALMFGFGSWRKLTQVA